MKPLILAAMPILGLILSGGPAPAQKAVREAEMYAKTLQNDKNPDKRLFAARELASIGKLKASYLRPHTSVLLEAFQRDADIPVRVAAGSALLVFDADAKEVVPVVLELLKNDKEPGSVLAVAAQLARTCQAKDAVPALEHLKKREEAKDDPKLRDQRLLQAVNQALQVLAK